MSQHHHAHVIESGISRLFAVFMSFSVLVAFGLWVPDDAVAACTDGNPGLGCALPEHEEAKAPMDVSQIAGKDAVSVTPYGGNLVVEATDISVPSVGGFAMHMTRTYHSDRLLLNSMGGLTPDFPRRRGPLGLGWTFHYGVIWPELNAQTLSVNYELVNGDGTREGFYINDIPSGQVSELRNVVPSGQTPYISKSLSVLYVDPSSQDRIFVHRPNGLKITFERLTAIQGSNLTCLGTIDIGGAQINVCHRFVATKIEDLSGNEWRIQYDLNDQEYIEHPIILSLEDDENRKIEFSYEQPQESSPVSATNPRKLDMILFDGETITDYTVETEFDYWHVLKAVETVERRRTEFIHDRSGTTAPDVETFGLLTGIKSPLGGGIGVSYMPQQFRTGNGYPRQATVQAVDRLYYNTNGINTNSGEIVEEYQYSDGTMEFTATVTLRVNGSVAATRTHRFHTYATSYCTDLNIVGLEKSMRLQEGNEYVEFGTQYGHLLTISNRALNFYCQSGTTPGIYRVSQRTESDSVVGNPYTLTTTPTNYDYLEAQDVSRSNGTSSSLTFHNVISQERLALGLIKSVEERLGNDLISKIVFDYKTGSSNHLLDHQDVYRTSSSYDTVSFTYHTSGNGKLGALQTATRAGVSTEFDYSFGIVSSVTYPGGSTMSRSQIERNGTYASETRHGVQTNYSWDDDWRLTQISTGSLEDIHIAYCSKSEPACSQNTICIGRGASCSAGLGSGDGRRTITFDGLGRRTSQEDVVKGSTKNTKSWNDFDYARRPRSYTDPIRGNISLSYDVAGRLREEQLGATTITDIERSHQSDRSVETITKEGITLFNEDDWAGRPLVRGSQRTGHQRVDITYGWTPHSDGWQATLNSTAWTGSRVSEVYDFLGRLVEEDRPEIGVVTHDYDGRGYVEKIDYEDLGYALCFTVNARGQMEETHKSSSRSCDGSSGELIRSAGYSPANTQVTESVSHGAVFAPSLSVKRTYTDFDTAARARNLGIEIPRALDAPAPWQGAELFTQAPNALDDFRSSRLAFTLNEDVASDGRYEMEVRQVLASSAISPMYDWGVAQDQCSAGTVVARGAWSAPNVFSGADIESHVQQYNASFAWDTQPNTLYCWRARAVKCHDGLASCQQVEVSPYGLWGVFAFNNTVAQPVTTDGWDTIPTNRNLNVEDSYLPCIGNACPNVAVRGEANVILSARRAFNLAGSITSLTYPSADSTLEGWVRDGSTITVGHNGLGDPDAVSLRLAADGATRTLIDYSLFNSAGAPTDGTISVFGYGSNRPGQFTMVHNGGGEAGVAMQSQSAISLSWGYDNRGRLESYSASRGGESLYAISNILYTEDSLIEQWSRNDQGLSATYAVDYDRYGQLESYSMSAGGIGSGTVGYDFDSNGNLRNRTGGISLSSLNVFSFANGMEVRNTSGVVSLPATSFGSFNNENRSTSATIAYDAEGRLVRDDDLSFAYSLEGHVETISGPDGIIELQMLYDGEGNLARLVGDDEAHYYLRDGNGRLLYEEVHDHWFYGSQFRDTRGRVVPASRRYEYIYMGPSHLVAVEHADGISSVAYAVRDWRDFEAVLIDADDAFTRAYREASPFGFDMRSRSRGLAAAGASLSASYLQNLGIGGCLNNGWRTMDGWSGRFSRPDPARTRHERLPQGANLYANNQNDPLNFADPRGMQAEPTDWKAKLFAALRFSRFKGKAEVAPQPVSEVAVEATYGPVPGRLGVTLGAGLGSKEYAGTPYGKLEVGVQGKLSSNVSGKVALGAQLSPEVSSERHTFAEMITYVKAQLGLGKNAVIEGDIKTELTRHSVGFGLRASENLSGLRTAQSTIAGVEHTTYAEQVWTPQHFGQGLSSLYKDTWWHNYLIKIFEKKE